MIDLIYNFSAAIGMFVLLVCTVAFVEGTEAPSWVAAIFGVVIVTTGVFGLDVHHSLNLPTTWSGVAILVAAYVWAGVTVAYLKWRFSHVKRARAAFDEERKKLTRATDDAKRRLSVAQEKILELESRVIGVPRNEVETIEALTTESARRTLAVNAGVFGAINHITESEAA